MGFLDYFGLTGNSGLVPGGHISANYSAGEGNVFVAIVKCRHCDQPAVSMDHYYPYDSQFNRCEDHLND